MSLARLASLGADHDAAISIYRKAISTNPEIAWMYRMGLSRELSNPAIRSSSVVINMATIPERTTQFLQALRSICFQADTLNIYLDRPGATYQGPAFQGVDLRLAVAEKSPGLRDNGKFLHIGDADNCYFFTVDDDIMYPPDYVEVLIEAIERYQRRAVVGIHGITIPEAPDRYFCNERGVLHFERGLAKDTAVNVLGTGTLAFHSSTVSGFSLKHFPHTGMADVCFAAYCRTRQIPLVAVARRNNWLEEIPTENTSLFQEFRHDDTLQSELLRRWTPWGNKALQQAIESALQHTEMTASARAAFRCLSE